MRSNGMMGRTSFVRATALSLSLGVTATAAHAASITDTAKQNEELSSFSEAIATAGLDQQLAGEGPFTVFAPTDQAFEQLPKSVRDQLMSKEHQAALTKLLQHHVVQGQEIAAKDVLGKQRKIDTASGDSITVDGTTQSVLLVPTGLTITQVGDRVVIEREGVAVPASAIELRDQQIRKAGGGQQQTGQEQAQSQGQQPEQAAAATATAEPSDMPMTEHQQQALESAPAEEQQQTAPEGTSAMPATEHQQQALAEGEVPDEQQQAQQAQGQHAGAQQGQPSTTTTAAQSDMPMTEHQQQALESAPGQEQQQTAPQGATAMPSTEHQRQALAEEELPGEQQQSYEQPRVEGQPDILREAIVVGADIQADNGVIHLIDAVLVPQSVLETLRTAKSQG
jgi:uncharacterized surface protein with fasciclin (FAS1) repeats